MCGSLSLPTLCRSLCLQNILIYITFLTSIGFENGLCRGGQGQYLCECWKSCVVPEKWWCKLHCIVTGNHWEVTVLANDKDTGILWNHWSTLSLWRFGKLIAESFVSLLSIVPQRRSLWLKQQKVYYFSWLFWLSKHGICVHLFFICSLFYLTWADICNRMTLMSSSIITQLYFCFPFILK